MRLVKITAAMLALAVAVPVQSSQAQRRDSGWERLGCRSVALAGRDRDVIPVGRRDGRFRAIRLAAAGNDVNVLDLKVVYGNGAVDDIQVRRRLRQGERTGPLDLRGRERFIQRVELTYRQRLNFSGTAVVCVEGLRD